LLCSIQYQSLITYYTEKLESNGNKASPSFRLFLTGNASDFTRGFA